MSVRTSSYPPPVCPTTDSVMSILSRALVGPQGVMEGQTPEACGLRNSPSQPPYHAPGTATSTCPCQGSRGGTETRAGDAGRGSAHWIVGDETTRLLY